VKIGILGSGRVGRSLGAWFAQAGFPVGFTSRTPAHAREAAQRAGHGSKVLDVVAVVDESDLIFLTLPFSEINTTLHAVAARLTQRILVDVTNPITPDHRALTIGHANSGAEVIAQSFPSAHVVKAFNAVFAEVYESQTPQIDGRSISIFFAGDESKSKECVREVIARLGFDPVDAGPLRNSRYLEPLSLLNIHLGRELGFGAHIGFSLLRNR
jgi:predicted dinucleotide-binding enzyme